MTEPLTENKIVLIVRKTRLDELIARFNTEAQARFYIEHMGADFSDYEREDETYKQSAQRAKRFLSHLGRLHTVDRAYVPNFMFGRADTVVVLGQDGLVANVLKYLEDQLVVGVNPDPGRWEGVLLPFGVDDLLKIIPEVFFGRRNIRTVTMARAELNTGQVLLAVNDLFVGPKSHTSALYSLNIGGKSEDQSSSGIIVSTGLGSTGWLRSIIAGATGISSSLSGRQLKIQQKTQLDWDADYLYFSIREPWPSKTSSANITFGKVTPETPLQLVSRMAQGGVIFSDGIEADYLAFNAGTTVTVGLASRKARLVVAS